MAEKIALAWSGGKDSALALYELRRKNYDVVRLLTTITAGYDRISMHGVRESLLVRQSENLGIPLLPVRIPAPCSNEEYETCLLAATTELKKQGIGSVAFGDLFLEDIRQYRENNLAQIGMMALSPLWARNTVRLAEEFIDLGFGAYLTCVDTQALPGEFAGRLYDRSLLAELPPTVDPCGENGEFHTFVFAGPIFSRPIPVRRGETVWRDDRFLFCDLLPD